MTLLVVPLGALLLCLLLTPASIRLARRWQLVDRPGGRRRHQGIVPRLGGLALYASFAVSLALAQFLAGMGLLPPLDGDDAQRRLGIALGATFVAAFGLLDDRLDFGSGPQYLAQVLAGCMSVVFLISIARVENPLGGGEIVFTEPLVWLLTIGWFVVTINTVNWLDGIDGLAATVAAIAALVLAIHMVRTGQDDVAVVALALLGCTAGFLVFNWPPARIFMGSAGSYFLGYALAALGLVAGARLATVLLVIGLPVLDAAWLVWWRWRHGQPVSRGDRNHLHFRLLDKGYSQRQIVIGYAAFCAVFGVIGLMTATAIAKLLALAALLLLAAAVLRWATPS